jgi:hypothetical protein
MTETRLLELQRGAGEPAALELRAGVQLPPIGIGANAAWRVAADGILDVHAYIYFDGHALFVQSANDGNPALVNGQPVGRAWTPVDVPCTIALASARLVFRDLDADLAESTVSTVSTGSSGSNDDWFPVADDDRTIAHRPEDSAPDDEDRTIAGAEPDDEDRTMAAPAPQPRHLRDTPRPAGPDTSPAPPMGEPSSYHPPPNRPFARGAFASAPDPESTRVNPFAETLSGSSGGYPAAPQREDTLAGDLAATPAMGAPMLRPLPFRPTLVRPAAGNRWAGGEPPPPAQSETQDELSTLPKDAPAPRPSIVETLPPPRPLVAPAGGTLNGLQPQPLPNLAPPGLLNVPPPAAPVAVTGPSFGDRLSKEWKETSTVKKVLLFLMPLMLPVVWFTFGEEPPPRRATTATGTTPAASGGGPPTASATQPYGYPALSAAAQQVPPPLDTTAAVLPPPPRQRPALPAASADARVAAQDASTGAPAADRREHQAADYVATGQYDQAAMLYERLALEHPENPAFREAARILRAKLDGGLR